MTEDLLRLITAAVDGELRPAEARRLKRVFARSASARNLYRKLKADARRLRALPKVSPPPDLRTRIMARVAEVYPPARPADAPPAPLAEPATTPVPRPVLASRRALRPWVPAAVAASVLVGVTTASFLFFSDQKPTARGKGTRPSDPESAMWLPDDGAPRPSVPIPVDRGHVAVVPHPRPVEPGGAADDRQVAPEPRAVKPDLIAFPPIPVTRFDLVEVRVPFLKALAEFDREDARQQFTEELSRDQAFRVDVFTRDPNRGVAAFKAAAKASGVVLLADETAGEKIRRQQAGGAVVYTESLTAAEVTTLVENLAREDAKYSPRLFDQLHAVPASGADGQDLKTIFGVDPGLFKRAAGERNGKAPDPSKPIGAGTADQVAKAVAGQGKRAEKSAVLLAWNLPPARQVPQTASAELKQYLARRGPRPAEAVPVLIVIRPGNG